ncbi:D-alanyl-D-alanine carboxypeptidase [Sanguibacter gelidistatuariae]|uniref:D-alanyl-D-alanine carboxypeptidase n=1 Tax=Sanguibacter gelidistatuariae TaxID=1814289 RepID=A0A1G6QHA6_9MICO|nr:D-alanyl-D-alanine carboxypeptidase [Sanguibacter gelidistatuariae]
MGPADTGAVRAAAPAQNPAWAAPRAGTQPWPPTSRPTSRPSGASRRGRRTTAGLVVGLVAVVVAVGLLLGGVFSRPSAAGTTTGPISAAGPVPAPGPATHLDDGLRATFDEAAADAARDGVELTLTSGWRSAADQQGLVDAALERYGSAEAARRWVLPPEASAHVAGLAIDVGPTEGALWLGERSERYGLCRTYANEVWHFEPVIERGGTCPSMHEDASDGWAGHA